MPFCKLSYTVAFLDGERLTMMDLISSDTYRSLWKVHGDEIVEKGTRIVPLFIAEDMSNIFQELEEETSKKEQ